MGFSHTYLTKRFFFQNYRDWTAMAFIGSYIMAQMMSALTVKSDNDWVMQHIYTDDESDISYRNQSNKTDGAVRRKIILSYAAKIRQMRAEKEREAQLDAFNYLNGTNLKLWEKIIDDHTFNKFASFS